MSAFLATMRRFFLGAIIVSVLSIALKRQGTLAAIIPLVLVCATSLYILFAVFSWIKINSKIKKMSNQFGQDLPKKGFISAFFRGLLLDLVSPVTVIVNLIKKTCSPVFMFISTYAIIVVYAVLWFVAIWQQYIHKTKNETTSITFTTTFIAPYK